ncbi:MAG: D-alanyl-D-alanine carboxypeptidase family protein [Longibaculum sp.]
MKKIVSVCLICLIMLVSFVPVSATNELKLNSPYAYLFDRQTNMVYINQKSEERIYPASMTKILTVSLALQKIDNLQKKVTITSIDLKGLAQMGASVAGFYEGEVVTYEDLLYGALLPSGADACNALARLTYGSQDQFVKAMNECVSHLGLKNTHFMNVTGLHDDQHYTTVKEMAMILNEALKQEEFVKVFNARTHISSQKNHTWLSSLQRGKEMKNLDIRHIDGAKSGFTDEAGVTLASTMTIQGHQCILVTAKATGQYSQNHIKDAIMVYSYMNQHYQSLRLYKKNEDIQDYWVLKTFDGIYHYVASQDISVLISKDIPYQDVEIKKETSFLQEAPLKQGKQLGVIQAVYQEKILYEYPIVMEQTIESSTLAIVLHYTLLLGVPFILVVGIICFVKKKKR